jgi:Uncharacterized protein conserved in bacteria (DUF2171)
VPDDDGYAVDYTAVERGTPVYGSEGEQVGTVAEVWDNQREHIFDGLVIDGPDGKRRFVDAPEVARTAERAVRLTITAAEVAQLGPPEGGGGSLGGISKLFKRQG